MVQLDLVVPMMVGIFIAGLILGMAAGRVSAPEAKESLINCKSALYKEQVYRGKVVAQMLKEQVTVNQQLLTCVKEITGVGQ